jgi:hypothetical protein
MMFFTVRAIPETTTASFSVDLLVMVAVYVYFEILTLQIKAREHRQRVLPFQSVYRPNVMSGAAVRIATSRQI